MRDGRLEKCIDTLVSALCADYERRARAIEGRSASLRVDTEFRYLNFKIYDAVAECVGEDICEIFIREIGLHTGYANSALNCMCESSYKEYKRRAKRAIAESLHLIDKNEK